MTARCEAFSVATFAAVVCLALASCGDPNLWNRDFGEAQDSKAAAAVTTPRVTGYWEGQVAMGGVRAKIEPGRITLALKCDKDGKILSQGSAPIVFNADKPARMTLVEDLSSGKDEKCGFRFYKGNEFRYRLSENGILELDFAGSALAEFKKLSD